MKIKVLAFTGPAGCGKDTVVKKLSQLDNFNKIVRCTTRPPRQGEVQGQDYEFYNSVDDFAFDLLNGALIEGNVFRNWCYGTKFSALAADKINIGAFDPAAIACMQTDSRLSVDVCYLEVSDKTRLIRQLTREQDPDIDEIFRRFKTDKEDYFNLEEELGPCYTIYSNETPDDLNTILLDIGQKY